MKHHFLQSPRLRVTHSGFASFVCYPTLAMVYLWVLLERLAETLLQFTCHLLRGLKFNYSHHNSRSLLVLKGLLEHEVPRPTRRSPTGPAHRCFLAACDAACSHSEHMGWYLHLNWYKESLIKSYKSCGFPLRWVVVCHFSGRVTNPSLKGFGRSGNQPVDCRRTWRSSTCLRKGVLVSLVGFRRNSIA